MKSIKIYPEVDYDFYFVDDILTIRLLTIIGNDELGRPIEYRDRFEFSSEERDYIIDTTIQVMNMFHFMAQKHIREMKLC